MKPEGNQMNIYDVIMMKNLEIDWTFCSDSNTYKCKIRDTKPPY